MLPNLLIIGVPKAGTTSLFSYLNLHKEVFGSSPKEPGYFHPLRWGEELSAITRYEKAFAGYSNQKYAMEATPGYFYGGQKVSGKMKELLPNSRVIVVLRDPVQRLFSFYKYKLSLGHIDSGLSFDQYLEKCKSMSIDEKSKKENYDFWGMEGGFYADLLETWESIYGDKLKVCFFDDLVKDRSLFTSKICDWLGIEFENIDSNKMIIENKSMLYRSRTLQNFAITFDKSLTGLWNFMPFVKKPFSFAYNLFNSRPHDAVFSSSSRKELENFYESDIAKTRSFLEQKQISNFPEWMNI
ncbi:MAG: hypothetical protein BEU02_01080 [Marine Group III euryarchaeote CG-Epi5]|uniref:Sulfotransferase domain-containing protein n=1 Tax=Marine Group III euryarchaeote CG-Epi5 TaxID=1888999 RepID=A0A1J5TNU9_9ARCH|nr:MAG: hypothetical protein BEU02_01080 [Marine Group III euryarchaeote CG-Epi5]